MKNNYKQTLQDKCKRIKIVLTDVDGVLTNSGQYFSVNGEVMKRFHVRDGMGVNILKRNKIPTIIVSKEKSGIVNYVDGASDISEVQKSINQILLN